MANSNWNTNETITQGLKQKILKATKSTISSIKHDKESLLDENTECKYCQ